MRRADSTALELDTQENINIEPGGSQVLAHVSPVFLIRHFYAYSFAKKVNRSRL